jgi:ferredoxin--NADP+ reductase
MTPQEIAEARQRRYNATVVSLQKPNSDLMIMRVRTDFPRPSHLPGQYCSLGLGHWEPRLPGCQEEHLNPGDERKLVRRAYSLSCSVIEPSAADPDEVRLLHLEGTDWLEFYIVLVRENADPARPPGLTPRLFMLREGDRLQVGDRIVGHYTLEPVLPGDTVLFLATGTGEAPHNYMIWELLRRHHAGKILSACCVRYGRDLGYRSVHDRLMKAYPNYRYLSLTTREGGPGSRKVYIQDLIQSGQLEEVIGETLDPARTHVFLCGNPRMIGVPVKDAVTGARNYPDDLGVIEVLERRGFRADDARIKFKGNIHFEEYW